MNGAGDFQTERIKGGSESRQKGDTRLKIQGGISKIVQPHQPAAGEIADEDGLPPVTRTVMSLR
jgi:hypothetical protein